jgi:hypothetical protein
MKKTRDCKCWRRKYLVGIKFSIGIIENPIEVPQKMKNKTTI